MDCGDFFEILTNRKCKKRFVKEKKNRGTSKWFFCNAVFLLMVLSGCADIREESEFFSGNQIVERDISAIEWVTPHKDIDIASDWDVVDYVSDIANPSNEDSILWMNRIAIGNGKLYSLLYCEKDEDGDTITSYELKSFDLSNKDYFFVWKDISDLDFGCWNENSFSADISNKLKDGFAQISSIDTYEDEIVILLTLCNTSGEIEHIYKVALKEDGKVTNLVDYVDLFPDINVNDGYILPEIICGEDKTTLLVDFLSGSIICLDKNEELSSYLCLGEDIANLRCIGKSIKGVPIFSIAWGKNDVEFFYMDKEGKHSLIEEETNIGVCSITCDGKIIMLDGSKLFSWDVANGDCSCLYSFKGIDAYSCMGITQISDGNIAICFQEGEEAFLYYLNNWQHPDNKKFVLLQEFVDPYTEKCAAEYNRTHPGVDIEVKQIEANDEYAMSLLLKQIKEGNGPDLIWVSRRHLETLQSAGALCSLDEHISQTLEKDMFGGVLEFGRIDCHLYAIPCEAYLDVLMIDEENWEEDSWTQEDAISSFKKWVGDEDGKKFVSLSFSLNPSKLFQVLFGSEIEHSEFVDFDTMTCNFQKQEFYDLLKFCKDYCDGDYDNVTLYSSEESIASVIKGKSFTYLFGGTFIQYSDIRNELGERYHTVGYPSKDKIVGVVECTHGVAINALSENKEIAFDFLEKLVSEEYQIKYSYSWVRRDVLENNVKNSWELEQCGCLKDGHENQPAFEINTHLHIPLAGKEDGTSYVDEYIDLMDNGVMLSSEYVIQDILLEEIQAFFEEQKSVEDVATIIQSRVNLYLEERK